MPRDPAALVPLYSAASEFDAAAIAEALTAEGIPATHYGLAATALGPYANTANPFPVMVRRDDLQRAAVALKRIRQESVDLDWSEVHGDPTEPEADAPFEDHCAACNALLGDLPPGSPCPKCGATDRRVSRRQGQPSPGHASLQDRVVKILVVFMIAVAALVVVATLAALIRPFFRGRP